MVVGDAGKVYYTANATASPPTWVARTTTGSTNNLYGVQMTGPDSWIVVGGNETIVRFTNAGANQAGSYGLANPVPVIVAPTSGFSRPVAAINGTASDTGTGVLKVEVRIQRANGQYWNGSTWVTDATGNKWNTASGTTAWSYTSLPAETSDLTISVRATDGMGLQATTAVNSTGGAVDGTPPTTTSDAKATYPTTGGTIKLTATDNAGGSGVASTWYRLGGSGGYTQYSGSIAVPTTAASYTLYFYSVDAAGNTESPAKTATFQVANASYMPVYRFYNKKNGSHFYTASEAEKASVIKNLSAVYSLDGVAYTVNTSNPANNQWLYRFYNKKNGSHFYTASEAEKASVIKNLSAVYSYDGPAYKVCAGSPPANSKTVWRFYNKKNGSHFYTADAGEKASVIKNLSAIYSLDGAAFYLAP